MSNNCIFCKIIAGEIPASKVFENNNVLAFRDINAASPEHILVIPKLHKASLNEFKLEDQSLLGELLLIVKQIAQDLGFSEKGYRTVINTGDHGGQTVHHLHLHLLAGRAHTWPPG